MALGVMSMLLSVHTVILLSIKSTACKIKVCGYEIKTGLFVFLQKKVIYPFESTFMALIGWIAQ